MNLTQKAKPLSFADVVGHKLVVDAFQKRIRDNDIPQAIFIQGISGTGKTTLAHLLSKALTCQHLENGEPCNKCADCLDINQQKYQRSVRYKHGSNVQIDEARAIEQDALTYDMMSISGKKIFIIDEIQETATKAPAALKNLLLIMERELSNVHFMFLTMSDIKIPNAIRGRTVYYKLHPVEFAELAKLLKKVAENQGVEITPDKHEAIFTIAQNSNGSPRDAIAFLDAVIERSLWKKEELVKELSLVPDTDIVDMFNAIMQGNLKWLSNEVLEVHVKKLREFTTLYLKGLNGYEYNPYQKKQFTGAKKFEGAKVLQVLDALNEVCKYGYVDQVLLDSIIIKATLVAGSLK